MHKQILVAALLTGAGVLHVPTVLARYQKIRQLIENASCHVMELLPGTLYR
jgi:hypothetical protein